MAEAIVGPIAPNIFQRSVGVAEKHLGYIWNCKKNIASLQTQVEKLDKEITDKQHAVTLAEKNARKVKERVKGWQKETTKISADAMQIIKDYDEKGKKWCLLGLCPNLVSRYQFGRTACKKETEIVNAMREAGDIREVSDRAIGLGKEISLSMEGCFTFDSRKLILEDIVKTLQDETMNCIGVYGLGGMGKTTLAKQVALHVTEEKMFEEVVFASVTQKVDMTEVQGQIASMLDLKLKESSAAERASLIHERLKGKKVLVVLDDLWTKLDLIQVGIPFGAEHMGCKVLVTSRYGSVLTSMGTRKQYDLRALKEEEAWTLFEEKVSHIVKDPKFLAVGEEIVKKCAGWPILIVTTAASLSKQPNLEIWEDALAQVKNISDTNMQDIVKSAIKSISYKYLNETHKRLFLLCGLMQGYALFEDILKYSWGWDLFVKDKVGTVEDARKRLRTLISDLKESCLLVDGLSSDHIKMHDVVRDIAISIARDDLKAFSHGDNDTDLSSLSNDDELNKCTAMVFSKCRKLPCFPERLECPSLELFILSAHRVDSKPEIPDTFFERTSKLKVLDMTGLSFPTLPSTLSFLTNLQSLHLDHCYEMEDISIVGELKKLQELSLIGSTIQELPSSLGQLSELKLLDLNRCSQLKVIPAGLISRLFRLEELHMSQSFDRWKSEEFPSNASFVELKCLPNLTCLKVELQDARLLAGDLNFEHLKRYEIIVGDMWRGWDTSYGTYGTFRDWFKTLGVKTSIALKLGTNSINHLQHVVNTLFKRIECLCLRMLKGITNVIPELRKDGFPELKHLRIQTDSEIQYIVDVVGIQHNAASFPALESLYLSGLLKVEKICNGRLMEGSFCKLTIVEVVNCNSLESLFCFSTIIALPCLQEIKVSRCTLLKQVVAREEGETKTKAIIFPQLGSIALVGLPNLTTFCSRLVEETTTREKVETVTQPLFDEKVQFPSLKTLLIENLDSIRAIWPYPVDITQSLKKDSCEINLKDKLQEIPIFQNLSEVTIIECKSLKFVFSASVAPSLNQMTKLSVQDCGVETTIGDKEGVEIEKLETGTTSFALPKVFSASVARSLNQLMKVCVPDCGVETLIGDEEDVELEKLETGTTTFTLPKLVKIELEGLPKLECFYPKEHTIEWPALKELHVVDCDKLYVLDFLRCSGKQGDDRIVKVIPSLKKLCIGSTELSTLSELADLNTLDRLEDLCVKCPCLMSLAPSSISFRLLKELVIYNCGGLINLLQPSAAKSLGQLKMLTIGGCEMIEEIIAGEVRENDKESLSSCHDDEIIFNELLHLRLEELPSLTHFCSSQYYTFNFPKLENVFVVRCPNMKMFCGGIVTTPLLNQVYLELWTKEKRWEGELNKTIQKLYEEREGQRLASTLPSISATNHSESQAQEEMVAATHTFEKKSKGKEVEVPQQAVEHYEKSETPRFSDPSCSNYTGSSSQLSPQISNQPDEVSNQPQISNQPDQVEAHTPVATVSTTLPGNQFEAQTRIHEMSPEKSIVEPEKESQVPINCLEGLGNKESKEAQGLTITLPSIEELPKPTKEGHELRTGTSQAASSSQQRDFIMKGSGVAKDSISLGEFVHILQTQAVKDVSAEQVEFVEDAIGQFCTYVDKAKECLERKRAISELKLQIQVLEDENDAVASAAPRFG